MSGQKNENWKSKIGGCKCWNVLLKIAFENCGATQRGADIL